MRSYHLRPGLGLAGLTVEEHDTPEPGRAQVLVRMRANALGYRDVLVMEDNYPIPVRPGVVPGCEGAGEVVAIGADVSRVRVGDRVMATVFPRWIDGPFNRDDGLQLGSNIDGVLTEYAVLGEDAVVPVPDHLSFEEAATLPLAAVTAWNALTGGRPLRSGDTVLTLGSGGVSLFVLAFARLAGARVVVTTSTAAKAERLRALGADEVVNYREHPDWSGEVRRLTDGRGVDLVVDTAGPLGQSLRAVAPGGEVAFVGYWLSGERGSTPVDPAALFMSGATLRRVATGSRAHLVAVNRAVAAHRLRPTVDRVFPFDEVPAAFRYCQAGGGFGKVVVSHGT